MKFHLEIYRQKFPMYQATISRNHLRSLRLDTWPLFWHLRLKNLRRLKVPISCGWLKYLFTNIYFRKYSENVKPCSACRTWTHECKSQILSLWISSCVTTFWHKILCFPYRSWMSTCLRSDGQRGSDTLAPRTVVRWIQCESTLIYPILIVG